jgi:hypothetical protein
MTLVVASTVLDTTWSEFSTVSYGASTLGTLSSMIDEVGLKLNRGSISASSYPSDTQVAQWLVRGKQEFAKTKSFTWRRRYVTTTTTAGVYRYSMPPDYDGGTPIIKDMTNDVNIKLISNSRYDDIFPDPSEETNDQPSVATIKNMELWLGPPPGGAYELQMEYLRSGDDATPNDFSWIPEQDRWAIVDFAVAESFEHLHDFEKATWHRQKYSGSLASARRADSKRKWSSTEKRARNIFQAR